MQSGLLSNIKQLVVRKGEAARTIKAGPFKGLNMNLDLSGQTQIYLGLFEREVYGVLRKLSVHIAMAIDIGAAYGEYTLYFLARTQATNILAFEPSEELRAKLLANVKLNDLTLDSRLKISDKFVGMEDKKGVCSLDSLLPTITVPCLIKMDIDGGEIEVLKGAKKLLQLPQVRWLIETHSPHLERGCISILSQSGYETNIIANAWWRFFLPEQRPIEHNRWLIASKGIDTRL